MSERLKKVGRSLKFIGENFVGFGKDFIDTVRKGPSGLIDEISAKPMTPEGRNAIANLLKRLVL